MSLPAASHLRETDAFSLHMERDPLLRSTIVAVVELDRAPDVAVLRHRLERATRLAPTFRQRLVPPPTWLVAPRWEHDPAFDLGYHLRRVAAPEPRTMAEVLELARVAGMTAFDLAHPLWELTVVEGLEGGRAALVIKVHHALTDGIGGIQLAHHVVDLERHPADPLGPLPPVPEGRPPSLLEQAWDLVSYPAGRLARTAGELVRALPTDVRHVLRNPSEVARDQLATLRSVARFTAPLTRTLSPVMQQRKLVSDYRTLEVPLPPLKAAARAAGGTLNDAFVAGITGGLRRYHTHHGAGVDQLRVTMPISLRRPSDPVAGNRITLARIALPAGIEDPVERMWEIDHICQRWREERAVAHSNTIAGVLNLLPVAVTGSILKHVDVLASNVPGFDGSVFVAGARVERFTPFGPTLGSAANFTLMSYDGRCCIGVNTDRGAVPDPDRFVQLVRKGFDEVLAAAPAAAGRNGHRAGAEA